MKKYIGPQTQQALHNFPFPLPPVAIELIYAITEIKKAAAQANYKAKHIEKEYCDTIQQACDEITNGTFDHEFMVSGVQGGAGTSINMNVNEVIAMRAQDIAQEKGLTINIHPNDHVNYSQSTNDVNPSGLRIVCIRLITQLLEELDAFICAFEQTTQKYNHVQKLGRTHIQDAIPTTIGEEFGSYIAILKRNKKRIEEARLYLYELNLGGTAIGNQTNASKEYRDAVYVSLKEITGLPLKPTDNMMALTSSTTDFCHLSATITMLALDISKIATDLRILSSGPRGGFGEIQLAALQPGSSIMPGKVNPVALESMNQIYYFISGKNQTIHQAAEGACLELAIMFPVIADSLISSIKLLTSGMSVLQKHCISSLIVNEERCEELLEQSMAYATLLTPILGYDVMSNAVKKALKENKSIREIILSEQLLSEKEFENYTKVS